MAAVSAMSRSAEIALVISFSMSGRAAVDIDSSSFADQISPRM